MQLERRNGRLIGLITAVLIVVFSVAVSAQGWTPFEFESGGLFEFHVQKFEYAYWDDTVTKEEYFHTIDVRETGAETEDGERLFDVTRSTRRLQTAEALKESVSFGSFSFEDSFSFGNPFVFGTLLYALEEMDFEVGERMNLLGMGRVSIVEEVTVAGRRGLLVQLEQGEAGNRRPAMEWVIDRKLPIPITVREYDEEGRVTLLTTLVKYAGN